MKKIKVAIADGEALFRKGLRLLIEDFMEIEVNLEAANGQELIQKLNRSSNLPDILLLDMKMPKLDGIETTKYLQRQFPSVKIIILSTHFKKSFVLHMIELGAASYLPKNTEPPEFEKAMKEVVGKGFYYSDEVMRIVREDMMSKNRIRSRISLNNQISNRELEILELICNQYTTSEIAGKLYISPRTVDGHRNNLLSKLSCKNTAGLVAYAMQNEIVKIY